MFDRLADMSGVIITVRAGLLAIALALLVLQGVGIVECFTYSPPMGFVPDDEDQYVQDGLAGLPALALYAGAVGFGVASLRDRLRAARWTVATALFLAAGLVATFAWFISMLDALS